MSRIAFIGLGNMGGPMARNLIVAGHALTVFDVDAAACDAAVADGATRAETLSGAVADQEIVVTMLPEGRHVREVYIGQGGILASAGENTLLLDCSTIDVATARAVALDARAAGLEMLDAPVSGGTRGAQAGTLTFMVGGDAGAFERARPVFAAMGERIVHTGASGNGQAAKICNNLVAGISMIAASEAFTLASRLGLDPKVFHEVISNSSGSTWVINHACPAPGTVDGAPSSNDYRPGFKAALMAKDLRLAQAAATETRTPTPLGSTAANLYDMFLQTGQGELDSTAIIKLIEA